MNPPHLLSVAPMMERTDRHFRYLMRLITRRTLLYTEMITTHAILHGDQEHLLGFHPDERPLALQLGGDDPAALATCAVIAQQRGYDEINLNVGCPSPRVQKGSFGACLMTTPDTVRRAVEAMRAACDLPVTVKHRIGVDDLDHYDDMRRFVDTVALAGCARFSVHARKAWLHGLSPRENREIPPLRYDDVYRLKRERPDLQIEINGGITSLEAALTHLQHVDAVMIGRAAYDQPWLFSRADALLYRDDAAPPSRAQVIDRMADYLDDQMRRGLRPHHVLRHMLNLFAKERGTRQWKQTLTEKGHRPDAGPALLREALAHVEAIQAPPPAQVSTWATPSTVVEGGVGVDDA
jgi:tRNA-dihydrouridine synthase A